MLICFRMYDNVLDTFTSPWLIVGRVFHGFSVGIFMTYCLVTLNEFSPYELKLEMVSTYQISIVLGLVVTNSIFPVLI